MCNTKYDSMRIHIVMASLSERPSHSAPQCCRASLLGSSDPMLQRGIPAALDADGGASSLGFLHRWLPMAEPGIFSKN